MFPSPLGVKGISTMDEGMGKGLDPAFPSPLGVKGISTVLTSNNKYA